MCANTCGSRNQPFVMWQRALIAHWYLSQVSDNALIQMPFPPSEYWQAAFFHLSPYKNVKGQTKHQQVPGPEIYHSVNRRFKMLLSGNWVDFLFVSVVSAMKSKDLSVIMHCNHVNKSAQRLSGLLCQPLPPPNNHYGLTITKTVPTI